MSALLEKVENQARSGALWNAHPFQLISLRKMLEFSAVKYIEMVTALERLTAYFNITIDYMTPLLDGEHKEILTGPLGSFIRNCDDMKLESSAAYAREIVDRIETSPSFFDTVLPVQSHHAKGSDFPPQELNTEIKSLRRIFLTEIESYHFMTILPAKQNYYNKSHALFWKKASKTYQSTAVDVEQAGKCFALNRNTACVFHLMRVTEIGLHLMAKSLNRTLPKYNRSWQSILRRCWDELKKPLDERCPEWAADDDFFSGATARLTAVKDAWRNPTMHVEINYDEEQAEDVWNHVSAFMRHLATRLPE